MSKADKKLFSLINILSENKKTIPANPTRIPMLLFKLFFSFLMKKWAKTVAVKGVLAINMAARLLWTSLTPYAMKKKGITKLITPIDANQYQSFENASILIFFKIQIIITGIAPKKVLNKAIVIGP